MTPATGVTLAGRWLLLDQPRPGGPVWRARDLRSGDTVACKLAGPGLPADRLRREAELWGPGGQAGQDGADAFLILPWVAGEALDAVIARGPLPVDEALGLAARLADALGALHARGVVHGDVQPANVVCGPGGPVLVDLGASWRPADGGPGERWGRAGYLAPERIEGAAGGAASDVFSLGCVLVELLTGQPPFGRDGAAALGRTVLGELPRMEVPDDVRVLLAALLAADAARRPADGQAAAGRLVEAARRAFVRAQTAAAASALVPEVALHVASEVTPLWHATEDWLRQRGLEPPFWAFAWAGGQALARCVLDRPELVRGRRVVDFACGGGLVAIAAARAGAADVLAIDIDPLAAVACELNAARNSAAVRTRVADVVGRPLDDVDVLLAGDVFYDAAASARFWPWLRALAASGVLVLVGDPGRAYAPAEGVDEVARFSVPTSLDLEGTTSKVARVLAVRPGGP